MAENNNSQPTVPNYSGTDNAVKFAKATDIGKAKTYTSQDKDTIAFVKKNGEGFGHIVVGGVEYGEGVFDTNTLSDQSVGSLDKGTNIGGKTPFEVLDIILNPEYAPKYTKGKVAITCDNGLTDDDKITYNNGDVLEVGTKTPKSAWYSGRIVTSSVVSTKSSATNRAYYLGTESENTNEQDGNGKKPIMNIPFELSVMQGGNYFNFDTVTSSEGQITVKSTDVQLKDGTDSEGKVTTSKGNNTQYSSSNSTTKIADTSNLKTDYVTTDYHVNGETVSGSHNIYYKFGVYGTFGNGGTLARLPLQTGVTYGDDTFKVKLKAIASGTSTEAKIYVPEEWQIKKEGVTYKISEFLNGAWQPTAGTTWELLLDGNDDPVLESITIGGGQTHNYKVYKKISNITNDTAIKFEVVKNNN